MVVGALGQHGAIVVRLVATAQNQEQDIADAHTRLELVRPASELQFLIRTA